MVPCPVCRSQHHRLLFRKQAHYFRDGRAHEQQFPIVRCLECGHDYVTPRLRGDLLAHHYQQHDLYVDLRGAHLEARRAYFAETLDAIEREQRRTALASAPDCVRLLDVACSEGTFVALARERGWQAQGVELSEPAARHGRDVLGLPVHQGTLECAGLPDASFDVVTVQSFLEHSEDPGALLREVHRVLAPGGLLYANVCNGRSLAARLEKVAWYNYDPVVHLSYFSPRSLSRLVRQSGFEAVVTRSRGVGARFFQTAVADTATSRRLDAWYQMRGHTSAVIKSFKRAASAVLSTAGLGQTLIVTARRPVPGC